MALPGDAGGVWPFPSVEADLIYKEGVLRVRKFKAARDSAALRLSGALDTRKRIVSAKASGELDIAGWIAAGAPGVSYMRRVAREGKAEFSVTADGPWSDPEGAARLVFRNAGFPGAAGAEGEVQLSLRGRVLRLARANAKLWGGVLEADGSYRTESGRVEGKASLRRVSLAAVPWKALGVPVSLAGTGDASVRLAGTADRLEGTVSLALPGGIERISSPGGSGPALRFPMSLEAGGSVSGGRDVRVDSFRLLAGKAESRGDGEGSIAGETLRLRGSLSLPAGNAADFGVGEPLAWEKVTGEWEISGPWSRLRGEASLSVTALAIRALPPLPLVLKIDGVPSEALHVSADVSAQRFKATAEGTWTSPFDPSRTASEWTVAVREIDLADSARWVSAVAASLGADAGGVSRYLAGIEGKGEAEGRIRIAAGKVEATGTVPGCARRRPRGPAAGIAGGGEVRERGIRRRLGCPRGGEIRRWRVPCRGERRRRKRDRDRGKGGGDRDRPGVLPAPPRQPRESEGGRRRRVRGPPRPDRMGGAAVHGRGGKNLGGPDAVFGRARGRPPRRRRRDVLLPLRVAHGADRRRGATLRRVADEGVAGRVGGPHVVSPRRRGAFRDPFRRRVERRGRRGDSPGGHRGGRPHFPGSLSRPVRLGAGDESFRRRGALRGVPRFRQEGRGRLRGRGRDTRPRLPARMVGLPSGAVRLPPRGSVQPGGLRERDVEGWEPPLLPPRPRADRGSPPRGGEDLGDRSRRIAHLSGRGVRTLGEGACPHGWIRWESGGPAGRSSPGGTPFESPGASPGAEPWTPAWKGSCRRRRSVLPFPPCSTASTAR